MDFEKILSGSPLIFDGAFGTELERRGVAYGRIPEEACTVCPDVVASIHRSYVGAGSRVVLTDTFGANSLKLARYGLDTGDMIRRAVAIARESGAEFVALDVGPTGRLIEPAGDLSFDEAYEVFKEAVVAGESAGADLIVIETMSDLAEAKAALLAAKENTSLPVVCSMSYDKGGRTFTGCGAKEAAISLSALGADAVGANCSTGPEDMETIVDELLRYSSVPVLIKPNAGLPDPVTGRYSTTPEEFCKYMAKFASLGVKLLGGCCGTSPEYISKLSDAVKGVVGASCEKEEELVLCSFTKSVKCSRPVIVGERINPTGKKLIKEALIKKDYDYILSVASAEADAGADMLDINVGVPGIDEREAMVNVVKAVQGIVDLPIQIDSSDPDVIEAALRVCRGKAVVNSVNGSEESMSRILPLVKKYGAAFIALTLDDGGIPETAEARCEIAGRIIERAKSLGISRKDIIVDCLTLTVSADPNAALVTLDALRSVKKKYGVKTALGVSNVSFGLPDRESVNRTFLTMALEAGLDFAIIDPNLYSMTSSVYAHSVLSCKDGAVQKYIEKCGAVRGSANERTDLPSLAYCVENGIKTEAVKLTKSLLADTEPLDVIEKHLIPILDGVGKRFEAGTLYLPQLITAADTVGLCFNAVKEKMQSGRSAAGGKKIILATVKGDIHDIGKSIVKVILGNYGYDVVDLGRDVAPEIIVREAISQDVKLVGLSALMTTTLGAMEETVRLLKSEKPDCVTMVGGAVLTEEYARSIGADYYAKDAMASVRIAKEVFKE